MSIIRAAAIAGLALWGATELATESCAADPVITEIVATGSLLVDADGDESDWIEIYWPGPGRLDLTGWYLTDSTSDLTRWRIPEGSLEADQYLVVFASGKDGVRSDELHTDFALDGNGEYVALVAPDGETVVSELAPSFPPQREGFGWGLVRTESDPPLVTRGSAARMFVPAGNGLGSTWTGTPALEPFPDGDADGWSSVTLGVGFPKSTGSERSPPVAYWSFDHGVADESGSAHDLARHGTSSSVDSPFESGRSILFNGTDDYLSAPIDVAEVGYSASLWFRTRDRDAGLLAVVEQDLGGGGHDRHLFLQGGEIAARVWNDETIRSRGLSLADDRWHHVVHAVGPAVGGQRIWVDGELVASGTKDRSDFDWQERINLGFSNDAASNHLAGRLDEVAIFDWALDASTIAALAAGGDPLALGGVGPYVETDIEDAVRDTSPSVLLRIPFDLAAGTEPAGLLLRLRYEDGFIAWLNGVEVARANAPALPEADATAPLDRSPRDIRVAESFDLGASLDILRAGRNVLAIQAFNDDTASSDFLIDPELVLLEGVEYRFVEPTPGRTNGSGFGGFVEEPRVSPPRGLYENPLSVTLATPTPLATILYTIDGSRPDAASGSTRVYSGPIPIDTTTILRAAATRDGLRTSGTVTHTYIFLASVLEQPDRPSGLPANWSGGVAADYGIDPDVVRSARGAYSVEAALRSLPSVSIVSDPANLFDSRTGIYTFSEQRGPAWERPASMELIHPGGEPGFQVDAGIRMHGNSSRIHTFTPKHPIRVLFKAEYGPRKLREALFPSTDVDRFDQVLLRGCSTDSWPVVDGSFVLGVQRWHPVHATYFRDQYMRDTQIALGRPSAHGTYVHLYLNGLYWGVYNLSERPTDSFQAEHIGGDRDEYDVLKDFAEVQSGSRLAWDRMIALAQSGLGTDAAYQNIQGNRPDGTRDPNLERLLDVENLIDYMIFHIHAGAEDWPDHNWWAGRRRGPKSEGFKFFSWDQEISNDSLVRTHTRISTPFAQPISSPSPSFLYGRLRAHPAFRRAFGDRVHELLFGDGLLTPEKNRERWLRRQSELDVAIVAESARWGDSKRGVPYRREVEWLAEMNWMHDTYWPDVQPIAIERFRSVGLYPSIEAPTLVIDGIARRSGAIPPGAVLTMQVPSSIRIIEELLVDGATPVSAFVPESDLLGSDWIDPLYSEGARGESWIHGINGVGYETSSGYEDLIGTDVESSMHSGDGYTSVYVRIPFEIASGADLGSAETLILYMLHDDGFVVWLNGVEVARENAPPDLDWSSAASGAAEAIPSNPLRIEIADKLDLLRVGTNLLAVQGLNFSVGSSDLLVLPRLALGRVDDAPAGNVRYTLDGSDPSEPGALVYAGPIQLDGSVHVRARALEGEEWSALEEGLFYEDAPSPLRITEIMYRPPPALGDEPAHDADDFEYIEILNTGTAPVLLPGTRIEGGVELEFSRERLWLDAGEVILLVEDREAFLERYPGLEEKIAGVWNGRLSNAGEELRLISPVGESVLDFAWDDGWYPETDGGGFSLVVRDPWAPAASWSSAAAWAPSTDVLGTPGIPDGESPNGGRVRPGDTNSDGGVDLSDAIVLLRRLFGGLDRPLPCEGGSIDRGGNLVIHDTDGDGQVLLTDAVALLEWLFRNGPPPANGTSCRPVEGCGDSCGSPPR